MNLRVIIAAVAGAVLNFFLGWLIYGVLLMGFYTAHTTHYDGLMKEMPNLFLIFISGLLMCFLYAFIFDRWAGFKTFAKGCIGGVIISFLVYASFDVYLVSSFNLFARRLIVVDIVTATILGGIIGGVIGWILGYKGKQSEAKAAS